MSLELMAFHFRERFVTPIFFDKRIKNFVMAGISNGAKYSMLHFYPVWKSSGRHIVKSHAYFLSLMVCRVLRRLGTSVLKRFSRSSP